MNTNKTIDFNIKSTFKSQTTTSFSNVNFFNNIVKHEISVSSRKESGIGDWFKEKKAVVSARQYVPPQNVLFLRNNDYDFEGIRLDLSKKYYKSLNMLLDRLTNMLKQHICLPVNVSMVIRIDGTHIYDLEDFLEDDVCVCCCGDERYNDVGYNISPKSTIKIGENLSRQFALEIQRCRQSTKSRSKSVSFNLPVENTTEPETPLLWQNTILGKLFRMKSLLYEGKQTVIYRMGHVYTNKEYVLKIMDLKKVNHDRYESKLLRCMKDCDNVLKLILALETPTNYLILTESMNMDMVDLLDMVGTFSEQNARPFMRDMANALYFMHKRSILHRDIKLANMLVRLDDLGNVLVVKISDFGMATIFKKRPLYHICGTVNYMAPEMVNVSGYDLQVDCWSLGVSLYRLICDKLPFTQNLCEQYFQLKSHQHVKIPIDIEKRISKELLDLISSLMNKNPRKRLTAKQLIAHSFIR